MERGWKRHIVYENSLLRMHTHHRRDSRERSGGGEEVVCWTSQLLISSCSPGPPRRPLQPLLRQLSASPPAAPGRLCTRQPRGWTDANSVHQANTKQMFPPLLSSKKSLITDACGTTVTQHFLDFCPQSKGRTTTVSSVPWLSPFTGPQCMTSFRDGLIKICTAMRYYSCGRLHIHPPGTNTLAW